MGNRYMFAFLAGLSLISVPAPILAKGNPVKVAKADAFKGVQNVVVGSFTIGFLTERTDSSKAGGGLLGGGFGGKSKARSALQGIAAADMQAITDAAYEDFKAQLTAKGYTVAPHSELLSSGAFAKAKPASVPQNFSIPFEGDKADATYFAPTELGQIVFYPGDVLVGGFGAIGAGMAQGQAQMGTANFAKSAGKGVVNVLYLIDFADSEKYGGWFRSSSAVKVKAGLAIAPGASRLTFFAPSGKVGSISLEEPVAVGGDFAEVKDTTGGTAKAVEAVSNVIGILGGIGSNKSRKYSFVAAPDRYRTAATDAVKQANRRLVDQTAALR